MLLDKLKITWKYYKVQNDLPVLETEDILAMIQSTNIHPQTRPQILFFNIALLLLMVVLCKGG